MSFDVLNKFHRLARELATSIVGRERPVTYGLLILILAIFIFSIAPIVWNQYLPLMDYPNHLARLQIYKTLSESPHLSKYFEFHWTLIPYFGFQLLALPFMYYLPIELAGKIATVIIFLVIYAGTILLDRELNHDNWGLSLFSGLFFYPGSFHYGLMPYLAGVASAICAFWIWVRYREKADGPWILVFIFSGLFVSVMHLFAFGIYAVCVASYECSLLWERLRVERRLRASLLRIPLRAVVGLIVPMLVWFSPISSRDTGVHQAMSAAISWTKGVSAWGEGYNPFWIALARKVEALISPIFFSNPVFEIPLVLIIFGLFVWALATRTIIVNQRMVIPLGAFALVCVFMPFAVGEFALLDSRSASAVAFIALASFGWGKASAARINVARLVLGVCLIVRVGSIFYEWQPAQAIIAEYDTASRLIPPGSRLMVIVAHDPFWGDHKPPLAHVPELPAAKRGVFDPLLFDLYGGMLLSLKPDYRAYSVGCPICNGDKVVLGYGDVQGFDYLMEIRRPSVEIPAGITLEEIERGRTFVLYRIE